MRELVPVFDFDGVFTDATSDPKFVEAFRAEVHRAIGADISSDDWDAAIDAVRAAPHQHGWWRSGRIIACACDIFLICQAAARSMLLDQGRPDAEVEAIMNAGFHAAWGASSLDFRPDAGELRSLLCSRPAYILTNASTLRVVHRLAEQGIPIPQARVFGEAFKDAVDHESYIDGSGFGLPRPLYHERPRYREALIAIASDAGTTADRLVVVGDNAELDLVHPAALGARVILLEHALTYDWERRWIDSLGDRGAMVTSVPQLRELLEEWQ